MLKAGFDDVAGADRIGAMEMLPRTPNASDRGGVKDDILTFAGFVHTVKTTNVSMDGFDTQGRDHLISTSRHRGDFVTSFNQLTYEV
jgi:hypothetical protein